MVVSFPLVTRSIRLSIELVDKNYEGAARSLGEFGATISFAVNISGETQTLPLAIFSAMQVPGQEFSTLRLVVVSILLSLETMIGAEYLNCRILRKRV